MKNKKILIIGLGLIGGSYAKGLTKNGYDIYAYNRTKKAIDYAIKNKIIIDGTNEIKKDFIQQFDRIIFSLYPNIFKEFINEYKDFIKNGTIITDVTGVKETTVKYIQNKLKYRVEFIPAHPMAGKETTGIENADEKIFENANYIITPTKYNSKKGIAFANEIGRVLKFRKISTLSIKEHDKMIAFLSQLTHCIAISLMTCRNVKNIVNFTGDSFRDLTRIANINETMWTELFLLNKKELLNSIDLFINQLTKLKNYIDLNDEKNIKKIMKLSTKNRKLFNKGAI